MPHLHPCLHPLPPPQAWALFAGSHEGEDGAAKGYSVYALGDKRCVQFSTCVGGTTSGLCALHTTSTAPRAPDDVNGL